MTGGENRRKSILKALRKKRIDNDIYGCHIYKSLNQYSKNKVHCSCPMCSAKTRNKGNSPHKDMAPPINYKISDLRKIQKLTYSDD